MARETVSRNKVKSTSSIPMLVAFTASQVVGFALFFNIFGINFMGFKIDALVDDKMFMFILSLGLILDFLLDIPMISKLKNIRLIKIRGPLLIQNLKRKHRTVHMVLCSLLFVVIFIAYTPIKNILPLQLFVWVTNLSLQLMVPLYLAISLSKAIFYSDIKRYAINKDFSLDNQETRLSLGQYVFNVANYFMPVYRYARFLRDITLFRYVVDKDRRAKKLEAQMNGTTPKQNNTNRRPTKGRVQ